MKASPLIFLVCLSVAPAQAAGTFGPSHNASRPNARHLKAPSFVNAVSDIEPGPFAPALAADAPSPPEPVNFAPPPDPGYYPAPYYPAPFLPGPANFVRRTYVGPHILYLRKPSKRAGPVVIYGGN
jgi:hypothetical protein